MRRPTSRWNRIGTGIALLAITAMLGAPTVSARQEATPAAGSAAADAVDLDVLFIGAHPDDEAFALATYGQWNENAGYEVGVITVTRGEGGGNAVGQEEGPALGILREAEERRAVAEAGIRHIYNLDQVDFYYTVSSPLTEELWGAEDTLERIVRVIRYTRPNVITTMNPSPTPGNHGHHQYAARLAVQAFEAAADPTMFPDQIEDEGLEPWRAGAIYRGGATGSGPTGPVCAYSYVPAEPTDEVYGIWSGTPSEANDGRSWAAIARDGQREYASQGWAVFPDVDTNPAALGCGYFTLIDSRVPHSGDRLSPTAMLEGALEPALGGLPLGTEFYLSTDSFDVVPGQSLTVTAHARPADGESLADGVVTLSLPTGWTAEGDGTLTEGDGEMTAEFAVTAAGGATVGTRAAMAGTLTVGELQGTTRETVAVAPAVSGTFEPLPQVAQFREWAASNDVEQLDSLIIPRFSMGIGESRQVPIRLVNNTEEPQSGEVNLTVPEGFSVVANGQPYEDLAPGASGEVEFTITNDDADLPTANEGGAGGDYPVTVATTSGSGVFRQQAGLNLVPVATVSEVGEDAAVDGEAADGEYTDDPIDLSRVWEGDDPDSADDASGSALVAWGEDGLHVYVDVTDDTPGTVLPLADAKRHWRTDSVEIAIDPLGDSENTSTTFKVGIFPTTEEGEPAAYRDADANQGPIEDTAPGMEVASTMGEGGSYTIETVIPYDALPAALDPTAAAINIFIYDSDTEDKTGQTRLGWSVFNGVQGDPYRWGQVTLSGFTPPAETAGPPRTDFDATQSVRSPQSILQSVEDGVPLAGGPRADAQLDVATEAGDGGALTVDLTSDAAGSANVFVWANDEIVAEDSVELTAGESNQLALELGGSVPDGAMLLIGFEAEDGGTLSVAEEVGG